MYHWVAHTQQKQFPNVWFSFLASSIKKHLHKYWQTFNWAFFFHLFFLGLIRTFFAFFLSQRFKMLRSPAFLTLNKLSSFNSHSREIMSKTEKLTTVVEVLLDVSGVFFIFWLCTFCEHKSCETSSKNNATRTYRSAFAFCIYCPWSCCGYGNECIWDILCSCAWRWNLLSFFFFLMVVYVTF